MYYVYMLRNEKEKLYFGYTNNLKRRLKEHNIHNKCMLVYYEAYLSELDARTREMKLKKYGQSRTHLKQRVEHSLNFKN